MKTIHPLVFIARIALALLLLPFASVACGQISVVSNFNEDQDFTVDVAGSGYAQSFTTGSDAISLLNVRIRAQSDADGTAQMNLRADSSGNPGLLIENLGTATIDFGPSTPLFTPTSPVDLLPNTTYWLTMGEDGSASGDFQWSITDSTNQNSSFGWTIGDDVLVTFGPFWMQVGGFSNESALFKIQTEPAPGTPITFNYTGVVDFDASIGSIDSAPFQAFAGETFSLTYTFDSNTPDCNDGQNGEFVYAGAVSDLEVTVGGNVYTAATGTIRVLNDVSLSDTYRVQADVIGPAVDGSNDISLSLLFRDSTGSAFPSGALPLVKPDPDAFDETFIKLTFESFPDFGDIAVVDVDSCVLLGDVNGDEAVNFLDIAPFIARLANGVYQLEADIDEDGVVGFLDISPFIAILSGT